MHVFIRTLAAQGKTRIQLDLIAQLLLRPISGNRLRQCIDHSLTVKVAVKEHHEQLRL